MGQQKEKNLKPLSVCCLRHSFVIDTRKMAESYMPEIYLRRRRYECGMCRRRWTSMEVGLPETVRGTRALTALYRFCLKGLLLNLQ
jgi:hypothetical protein